LSEKIHERTGVALSHVTLKRVWGKVKYDSLPNTHTLDTLVQFLGYENWRDFKSQNSNGKASKGKVTEILSNGHHHEVIQTVVKKKKVLKSVLIIAVTGVVTALIFSIKKDAPKIIGKDYSFSSKKVVAEGVPNSVIFNYDATKSPYDSVVIQQSWDRNLAIKVSKDVHQHTSIYYYPDYYKAKLIVGGKVVSMHRLLIKSNGWVPIVALKPVPVYFSKAEATTNGKFGLTISQIESKNIKMQPSPPYVLYSNVLDMGEIYSDNFVFETSVRNDYREGAAVCQNSTIYILCEGTAIGIPLCSKGCISNADLLFTNFFVSGKDTDLSAFGVDFKSYIKVRVESKNGKGTVYLNDKLAYTVSHDVVEAKIIGFDFSFQGTGSIAYVKLSNGTIKYEDDF